MGRLGVDQATGAAAVLALAELAAENEDIETARLLYERARRKWKSPYAQQALQELDNK